MSKILESDLYLPVKAYLETLGYEVKGEVRHCDMTAVKDDTLIVVELKRSFSLDLIYQGLQRQTTADSVYLAVPLPRKGYLAPKYKDMLRLCRRLEIGLIFVAFSSAKKPQIDVAVHPTPRTAVRRNKKERMAILTEHNARSGSRNTGGVTRRKILTSYKEMALNVAKILHENGELTATQIRGICGYEKTSRILNSNYYKWFEKVQNYGNKNNTYQITESGIEALKEYSDLLS